MIRHLISMFIGLFKGGAIFIYTQTAHLIIDGTGKSLDLFLALGLMVLKIYLTQRRFMTISTHTMEGRFFPKIVG